MEKKNNENEINNSTENNNNEINNNTKNNSNNENKIIIILLLIIIIIMSIFILLLLTNRVNISSSNNSINGNNSSYTVDENIQNNTNKQKNIYKIEYKEEIKEYKNSKDEVVIKNKRNIPYVTNEANQLAAEKITKYLTNVSNDSWEELNKLNYTNDNEFIESLKYEVGIHYTFSNEEINKKIISFKYSMDGSMGGVGWNGSSGYNFDYETGNLLEVNNIMNYNNVQNDLYEYIISAIEKEHNSETLWHDDISGYWKDIVKKDMFSQGNWLFTNSGINIYFGKYSLGPGSTGVVEVKIPTQEINKYLYDKYKY